MSAARSHSATFWALTVLARAASAAKEVLLAMALGASPGKDALVVAWTAPTLLATYCNETLPALLTPLWVRSRPGTRSGARGLVLLALAVLGALSLAGLLWPRALVALVAPALPQPARGWAVALEPWLAVNILLLGAQSLLAARLNAERRFAWAPLGAGLPASGVIVALALTRAWPLAPRLTAIAVGLTAGSALGLASLLAACRGSLRHAPMDRSPASAPVALPVRPLGALLLAMLVLNLIPWAERIAASGLNPGSVAAYDYGERLVLFVFGVSVAPFTAVSFTQLAELAGSAAFARHLERQLQALLALAMPLAAGMAVFAPLITRCVYGWGRFNAASLAATIPVVRLRGAALGLDAAFYFLLFALYARGQAAVKLPAVLVLAAVNVPLAFAGAHLAGVAGMAGAHLAAAAAAVGWMGIRRHALLPGVAWRGPLAAAAGAGGLTLAAALAVRQLVPAAVAAGRLGGAASWGWMLAVVAVTAAATLWLARWLAPALLDSLRQMLWPPALAPARESAA